MRSKLPLETFIETSTSAMGNHITELLTGTCFEFWILSPVGQCATLTAIALVLALCVGRFRILGEVHGDLGERVIQRMQPEIGELQAAAKDGKDEQYHEGGVRGTVREGDALEMTLVHQLERLYVTSGPTPPTRMHQRPVSSPVHSPHKALLDNTKTEPGKFIPPFFAQTRRRPGDNARDGHADVEEVRTPVRAVAWEGETETVRKSKEQLERLREWG